MLPKNLFPRVPFSPPSYSLAFSNRTENASTAVLNTGILERRKITIVLAIKATISLPKYFLLFTNARPAKTNDTATWNNRVRLIDMGIDDKQGNAGCNQ